MMPRQSEIADGRASTDASLGAERATADDPVTSALARRYRDDLIEHDRRLADLTMLTFRDGTDRTLSLERSDSPSPDPSVARERQSADRRQQQEREMADALLLRERNRSDIAVATNRKQHDKIRDVLEVRRRVTDDQLSSERHTADTTASALGESSNALAQAQRDQQRRHEVLAIVAHDLRSPLSVISMSAETIAASTRDAVTATPAKTITLAVARMERLLIDLLDVARIESGTLRIVKLRHHVGHLLRDVQRSYGPIFTARDLTFSVAPPADDVIVDFDYDRIVQVLSNLLGNAMKFTDGGGTVSLRAERQSAQVMFELRDDGVGIEERALPHVFERFRQIDSDLRRGLGLGLHICENLIEAHGGRIWVESVLGEGTTFRFTLPTH